MRVSSRSSRRINSVITFSTNEKDGCLMLSIIAQILVVNSSDIVTSAIPVTSSGRIASMTDFTSDYITNLQSSLYIAMVWESVLVNVLRISSSLFTACSTLWTHSSYSLLFSYASNWTGMEASFSDVRVHDRPRNALFARSALSGSLFCRISSMERN